MKKGVKTTVAQPILSQLRTMEVGDVLTFPAEKRGSVKAMCSEYGFEWDKKFATSINRKERTITVTRKS